MDAVKTFDNSMDLELEFEVTRQEYLQDLEDLRNKYVEKLSELALAYGSTISSSY